MGKAADKSARPDVGSWRFRGWHLFVLCCAVIYFGPMLEAHPEQDQCTFGTNSTALYDRLYSEAVEFLGKHQEVRLAAHTGEAGAAFSRAVGKQMNQFASTRENPAERLAAVHALLRRYGMEFDSIWVQAPNLPLSDPRNRVYADYLIFLPKLNWFCPKCYLVRTGRFRVHFIHDGDGIYDRFGATLGWKTFFPSNLGPFAFGRRYEDCPRNLFS